MSLAKLQTIREQIADLKHSLESSKTAALPLSDVEASINATVDAWASKFDVDWLGRGFASPEAVMMPESFETACAGEAGKQAIILAWHDPAGLKQKLLAAARPYAASKGMATADRPAFIRKQEAKLFDLEVQEEKLVTELERDGLEVYRRPDADPAIILATD